MSSETVTRQVQGFDLQTAHRAGLSDYSWEHIPSWNETGHRDIRKSRGTTWIYELEESLINGQWWISDGIFIEIS